MTPESLRFPARTFRISAADRILAVICLMYLVFYVDRVNIATLAPLMSADLRLSNADFGLAVSAFAYPYAAFQLIGGWVGDRLGPRLGLTLCGIVVAIASAFTGLAGGLGSLLAVRLALGFGEGSAFPTATKAISQWLPNTRWGFAQGITHAAARLGNALTPLLIAALLQRVAWRASFLVAGLVTLLWVILWIWIFPKRNNVAAADTAARGDGLTRTIPWLRLARRLLPVTAVDFCYGWALWVSLTWLPSFFFQRFHLDLLHSALFSSAVLMSGVIGDMAGGWLSDRLYRRTGNLLLARRNIIIAAMLGAPLFLLPVVISRDLMTVTLCLSAACFFSELAVGPIWSVPMDIAPDYAGSASGIMNFGFGLAGIVSPLVIGELLDLTGDWTVPFYCTILVLLCGAVLSFHAPGPAICGTGRIKETAGAQGRHRPIPSAVAIR